MVQLARVDRSTSSLAEAEKILQEIQLTQRKYADSSEHMEISQSYEESMQKLEIASQFYNNQLEESQHRTESVLKLGL